MLWWQYMLNDADVGQTLKDILDNNPWETQYAFTANFELP